MASQGFSFHIFQFPHTFILIYCKSEQFKGKINANTSYTCIQHVSWMLEEIKLLSNFFEFNNIPNQSSKLWILAHYHTLLREDFFTKQCKTCRT